MCQACLTKARTWAQQQGPSRRPGACFGPEVTCVLGCGQLGPIQVSIPGSWALTPNTVLLASGTLICGKRDSSGASWLPNGSRLAPIPHTVAEPAPPGAQQRESRSIQLSARSPVWFTLG